MPANKLTPISYLVLGIVAHRGPCTSYEMKREVAHSVGNFWHFPHAQLYAEPASLVADGLLSVKSEKVGRRRRHYTITRRGLAALRAWLAAPTQQFVEIRDLALLKLFFSRFATAADIRRLANAQLTAHQTKLAEYQSQSQSTTSRREVTPLELGLRFERIVIEFWKHVAAGGGGGHGEMTFFADFWTPKGAC